jgi:DNA anti-recombination protein RmuC
MSDDELRQLLDTMRQENSAAHEETRGLVERIDKKVDDGAADVGRRFDAVDTRFAELRRHLDVSAEATKHEVRLLAESVAHLNEDLQRTRTTLEETIERTAGETQAMIKSLTPNWTAA